MVTAASRAKRLERLENAHAATCYGSLTADELNVRLLEQSPDEKLVSEIVADIRETAQKQTGAAYEHHLEWIRAMWRKRTGRNDYQPGLTGGGMGEYQDWDKPNVMQRRAALRLNPRVKAILKGVKH